MRIFDGPVKCPFLAGNGARKGTLELVHIHDFIGPKLSRALPYGVGSRHRQLRSRCHPPMVANDAKEAPYQSHRPDDSADGGGSNGYRVRLWKIELQMLADELKLPVTV